MRGQGSPHGAGFSGMANGRSRVGNLAHHHAAEAAEKAAVLAESPMLKCCQSRQRT